MSNQRASSAGVVQSRWRQMSRISARRASGWGRGPTAFALGMNTLGSPSKRASRSSSGAAAAGCWLLAGRFQLAGLCSRFRNFVGRDVRKYRLTPLAGRPDRKARLRRFWRSSRRTLPGLLQPPLLLRRAHNGEPARDNAMNVPDPSGWPSPICRLTGGWGLHAGEGSADGDSTLWRGCFVYFGAERASMRLFRSWSTRACVYFRVGQSKHASIPGSVGLSMRPFLNRMAEACVHSGVG